MEPILISVRDKISWLSSFLQELGHSYKDKADDIIAAIQIPRNIAWKDNHIQNLLEINDRKRTILDEKIALYNLTILPDVHYLLERINGIVNAIKDKTTDSEIRLQRFSTEIKAKHKKYEQAFPESKNDPWLCLCELKTAIKMFSEEKKHLAVNEKMNLHKTNEEIEKFDKKFCNIYKKLIQIEETYHEKVLEIYKKDYSCFCEDKNQLPSAKQPRIFSAYPEETNECDFDMSSEILDDQQEHFSVYSEPVYINNSRKSESQDNLLENSIPNFEHLTDNINMRPSKCGIYRYKKSSTSKWSIGFVVLTNYGFIHIFNLNKIFNQDINIRSNHNTLFQKLLAHDKKIGFFQTPKVKALNLMDENDLRTLCDEIITNFHFADCKDYTFMIENNHIKWDKERFELCIEQKRTGIFSDFFISNSIRIKSFVLKDIYDIYFQASNNDNHIHKPDLIEEVKNVNEQFIDADEPQVTNKWQSLEDRNPWEDL